MLNDAGLAAVNAASGGKLIIGAGQTVSVNPNYVFGTTTGSGFKTLIEITTGPAVIIDNRPQLSALSSGLPFANGMNQALMASGNAVLSDINGRLYNLRAGWGDLNTQHDTASAFVDLGSTTGKDKDSDAKQPREVAPAPVPASQRWEFFTTVNYGYMGIDSINNQAGVHINAWAPGIGLERHLNSNLTLGAAISFLQSNQTFTNGLGSVDLEGPALSAYTSYVQKNFWADLLYSYGTYNMDTQRNPGFGLGTAFGSSTTHTNAVQLNTGYNFRFQGGSLVTGPYFGIDYLRGTISAFSETGAGGIGALSYGSQSYDSLVTRVGWSATKTFLTEWARITPQIRLGYERQNFNNNNGTSVQLVNTPAFQLSSNSQRPGQDYLVAGAGVNFQFTDRCSMLLTYQGQFFRQNMQAHFGGLRLSYSF